MTVDCLRIEFERWVRKLPAKVFVIAVTGFQRTCKELFNGENVALQI